jgi:hypothetical protein
VFSHVEEGRDHHPRQNHAVLVHVEEGRDRRLHPSHAVLVHVEEGRDHLERGENTITHHHGEEITQRKRRYVRGLQAGMFGNNNTTA